MAIGERTWEVLVLLSLSCAAFLIVCAGVSSWSDLNQPVQASSQTQRSGANVPTWIYHEFIVPEVRDVQDGGVLSKARSYVDGFVEYVESQLGNPFGFWSGEGSSRSVQDVEDENGVVVNVKSFFAGIGDTIKSWGEKTISPPAILHATEPLGRFPHSDMAPTSTLASRLTEIVGKVMEMYYADSVVADDVKTCYGILEEQTRKLVKSLKHELKEKLCSGELHSVGEEKFCNFYRSHPKLATLMVFTKLEVDPIGVALMRTTTAELCASSNGDLVHSVHKMDKLARRLRLSSFEVGQNGLALHEHDHEHEHEHHEHEHEHREHGGLQASHLGAEVSQSCKDCYLQGVHSLMKDMKARIFSTCQAPATCMIETCAFIREHRYLSKTYLVLKIRPWDVVSVACAGSCRSSPSYLFPLGMPHPQTAVSEPHAPNLPRFGHRFFRRLDIEQPGLVMAHPDMPVSQPAELDRSILRRSSRCRRLAKLQAFRRAMQLRGNILGLSDSEGNSGLEGNGQAHLVVVVNGHPFGPSNIRDIFSDLQNHMDAVAANINSDSRPEPWSDVVLFKPFHEPLQTIAQWKVTQGKSSQFGGRQEHQAVDLITREQVLDEFQGRSTEGQVDLVSVEGSDGTVEHLEEDSSSSSSGDIGESTTSVEDSSGDGYRAAV